MPLALPACFLYQVRGLFLRPPLLLYALKRGVRRHRLGVLVTPRVRWFPQPPWAPVSKAYSPDRAGHGPRERTPSLSARGLSTDHPAPIGIGEGGQLRSLTVSEIFMVSALQAFLGAPSPGRFQPHCLPPRNPSGARTSSTSSRVPGIAGAPGTCFRDLRVFGVSAFRFW